MDLDQNDPLSRVHELQDLYSNSQKKTFTKWVNFHLAKVNSYVEDLYKDLSDGIRLIKIVEVIANIKLHSPNKGILRVQKIENINIALRFLKTQLVLQNIAAEDIVDENNRLILGLIWTIILRFQIQELNFESINEAKTNRSETNVQTGPSKVWTSVKESLLIWCQRETNDYNIEISDFSKSWNNGKAFAALIHKQQPDSFDYVATTQQDPIKVLEFVFEKAETVFKIPRLLDPEDVAVNKPDEKSILTYLSSVYSCFSKRHLESTCTKRTVKVIERAMQAQTKINDYESRASSLLAWIERKIIEFSLQDCHPWPNHPDEISELIMTYKNHQLGEKPEKLAELLKVDELLFRLQCLQNENHLKLYQTSSKQDLCIKRLEHRWQVLEQVERMYFTALVEQDHRLERIEQDAKRFFRQVNNLEQWLIESWVIFRRIIDNFHGRELPSDVNTEALLKMANAFLLSVESKVLRFEDLSSRNQKLEMSQYWGLNTCQARFSVLWNDWTSLKESTFKQLKNSVDLMSEYNILLCQIGQQSMELLHLSVILTTKTKGEVFLEQGIDLSSFIKDSPGIQIVKPKADIIIDGEQMISAALDRHSIAIRELKVMKSRILPTCDALEKIWEDSKRLGRTLPLKDNFQRDECKVRELREELQEYSIQAADREKVLKTCLELMKSLMLVFEHQSWLQATLDFMKSVTIDQNKIARSLILAQRALKRNKAQIAEIDMRRSEWQKTERNCRNYLERSKICSPQRIKSPPSSLRGKSALKPMMDLPMSLEFRLEANLENVVGLWNEIDCVLGNRTLLVNDCYESAQYYAEAHEASSWITEKRRILVHNKELESALSSFVNPDQRPQLLKMIFDFCGNSLSGSQALLSLNNNLEREILAFEKSDMKKLMESAKLLTEASVDQKLTTETMSKAENDKPDTLTSNVLPRVIVLHDYTSQDEKNRDLSVKRGELLYLIHKPNECWWRVRRNTRDAADAWNKVCEMYEKSLDQLISSSELKEKQNEIMNSYQGFVPASYLREVILTNSLPYDKSGSLVRRISRRKADNLHFDRKNLVNQQTDIETCYADLVHHVQKRKKFLIDAIGMHQCLRSFSDINQSLDNERDRLNQEPLKTPDSLKLMKKLIAAATVRVNKIEMRLGEEDSNFKEILFDSVNELRIKIALLDQRKNSFESVVQQPTDDDEILNNISGLEMLLEQRNIKIMELKSSNNHDLKSIGEFIRKYHNIFLETESTVGKISEMRFLLSKNPSKDVENRLCNLDASWKELASIIKKFLEELDSKFKKLSVKNLVEETIFELDICAEEIGKIEVSVLAHTNTNNEDTSRRTTRYTLRHLRSVEMLQAKQRKLEEISAQIEVLKLKIRSENLGSQFDGKIKRLEHQLESKSEEIAYYLKAQDLFKRCNMLSSSFESHLTRLNSMQSKPIEGLTEADRLSRILASVKIAMVKDIEILEVLRNDINLMIFTGEYEDVLEGLNKAEHLSSVVQESLAKFERSLLINQQRLEFENLIEDIQDEIVHVDKRIRDTLEVAKMQQSLLEIQKFNSRLLSFPEKLEAIERSILELEKKSSKFDRELVNEFLFKLTNTKINLNNLKSQLESSKDLVQKLNNQRTTQYQLEQIAKSLEQDFSISSHEIWYLNDARIRAQVLKKYLENLNPEDLKDNKLYNEVFKEVSELLKIFDEKLNNFEIQKNTFHVDKFNTWTEKLARHKEHLSKSILITSDNIFLKEIKDMELNDVSKTYIAAEVINLSEADVLIKKAHKVEALVEQLSCSIHYFITFIQKLNEMDIYRLDAKKLRQKYSYYRKTALQLIQVEANVDFDASSTHQQFNNFFLICYTELIAKSDELEKIIEGSKEYLEVCIDVHSYLSRAHELEADFNSALSKIVQNKSKLLDQKLIKNTLAVQKDAEKVLLDLKRMSNVHNSQDWYTPSQSLQIENLVREVTLMNQTLQESGRHYENALKRYDSTDTLIEETTRLVVRLKPLENQLAVLNETLNILTASNPNDFKCVEKREAQLKEIDEALRKNSQLLMTITTEVNSNSSNNLENEEILNRIENASSFFDQIQRILRREKDLLPLQKSNLEEMIQKEKSLKCFEALKCHEDSIKKLMKSNCPKEAQIEFLNSENKKFKRELSTNFSNQIENSGELDRTLQRTSVILSQISDFRFFNNDLDSHRIQFSVLRSRFQQLARYLKADPESIEKIMDKCEILKRKLKEFDLEFENLVLISNKITKQVHYAGKMISLSLKQFSFERDGLELWISRFEETLKSQQDSKTFRFQLEELLKDLKILDLRNNRALQQLPHSPDKNAIFSFISQIEGLKHSEITEEELEDVENRMEICLDSPYSKEDGNQLIVVKIQNLYSSLLKTLTKDQPHASTDINIRPIREFCANMDILETRLIQQGALLTNNNFGNSLEETRNLLTQLNDSNINRKDFEDFLISADQLSAKFKQKNNETLSYFVLRSKDSVNSRFNDNILLLDNLRQDLTKRLQMHEASEKITLVKTELARIESLMPIVLDSPHFIELNLTHERSRLKTIGLQVSSVKELLHELPTTDSDMVNKNFESLNTKLTQEESKILEKSDLVNEISICEEAQTLVFFISQFSPKYYDFGLKQQIQELLLVLNKQKSALSLIKTRKFLPKSHLLPEINLYLQDKVSVLENGFNEAEEHLNYFDNSFKDWELLNEYQFEVAIVKKQLSCIKKQVFIDDPPQMNGINENVSVYMIGAFLDSLETIMISVKLKFSRLGVSSTVLITPESLEAEVSHLIEALKEAQETLDLRAQRNVWFCQAQVQKNLLEQLINQRNAELRDYNRFMDISSFNSGPDANECRAKINEIEAKTSYTAVAEVKKAEAVIELGIELSNPNKSNTTHEYMELLSALRNLQKNLHDSVQAVEKTRLITHDFAKNNLTIQDVERKLIELENLLSYEEYSSYTYLQLKHKIIYFASISKDLILPALENIKQIQTKSSDMKSKTSESFITKCKSLQSSLEEIKKSFDKRLELISQFREHARVSEYCDELTLLKNFLSHELINDSSMDKFTHLDMMKFPEGFEVTKLKIDYLISKLSKDSKMIHFHISNIIGASMDGMNPSVQAIFKSLLSKSYELLFQVNWRIQFQAKRVFYYEKLEQLNSQIAQEKIYLQYTENDLKNLLQNDGKGLNGYQSLVKVSTIKYWLYNTLEALSARKLVLNADDLNSFQSVCPEILINTDYVNKTIKVRFTEFEGPEYIRMNFINTNIIDYHLKFQNLLEKCFDVEKKLIYSQWENVLAERNALEIRINSFHELFDFRGQFQMFELEATAFNDWLRAKLRLSSEHVDWSVLKAILMEGAEKRATLSGSFKQLMHLIPKLLSKNCEKYFVESLHSCESILEETDETLTKNWALLVETTNTIKERIEDANETNAFLKHCRILEQWFDDKHLSLDRIKGLFIPEELTYQSYSRLDYEIAEYWKLLSEIQEEISDVSSSQDLRSTRFVPSLQIAIEKFEILPPETREDLKEVRDLISSERHRLDVRIESLKAFLKPQETLMQWMAVALKMIDWFIFSRINFVRIEQSEIEEKEKKFLDIRESAKKFPNNQLISHTLNYIVQEFENFKYHSGKLKHDQEVSKDLHEFFGSVAALERWTDAGFQTLESITDLYSALQVNQNLEIHMQLAESSAKTCQRITMLERETSESFNNGSKKPKQLWTEIKVDPNERFVTERPKLRHTSSVRSTRPNSMRLSFRSENFALLGAPAFEEPCLKISKVYMKVLIEFDGSQVLSPKWQPSTSKSSGFNAALYTKSILIFRDKVGLDQMPLYRIQLKGLRSQIVDTSAGKVSIKRRHPHRLHLVCGGVRNADLILAFPSAKAVNEWQESLKSLCDFVEEMVTNFNDLSSTSSSYRITRLLSPVSTDSFSLKETDI